MVTIVLGTGMTTLAFFQKASSVGWAWGSARIPRRISAGVIRRNLSQSVPFALLRRDRSGFDVLPIPPSLARLRAPRRDDAPFVFFSIGINYCDFQSVNQPDRIDSILAIAESVIRDFEGRAFEDPNRVLEGNSMQLAVAAVLFLIPSVAHGGVFTQRKYRSCGRMTIRFFDEPYPALASAGGAVLLARSRSGSHLTWH